MGRKNKGKSTSAKKASTQQPPPAAANAAAVPRPSPSRNAFDDLSWMSTCVEWSTCQAEVAFILSNTFHISDQEAVFLEAPRLRDGAHRSTEVLGQEDTFARHYIQVLDLVRQHKIPYKNVSHHFSLRLAIEEGPPEDVNYDEDEQHHQQLTFPWYDSLDEMGQFFDFVQVAKNGQFWDDMDQSWSMHVVCQGDRFYCREANVSLPKQVLRTSIAVLCERMQHIITRLMVAVGGEDYWSQYRYDLIRSDMMKAKEVGDAQKHASERPVAQKKKPTMDYSLDDLLNAGLARLKKK